MHTMTKLDTDPYGKPAMVYLHEGKAAGIAGATVRDGIRLKCWKIMPIFLRAARRSLAESAVNYPNWRHSRSRSKFKVFICGLRLFCRSFHRLRRGYCFQFYGRTLYFILNGNFFFRSCLPD